MRNAVAYLRKSTDRKESQIHSLEAQRREISIYAERNGIQVIAWCVEAISGTVIDRPELNKALSLAKKHSCPIICKSLSRIGRNASQVLQIIDNTELVITDMGQNVDSNFLSLLAVINQIEVREISKRTKSALALLKAQGVKLGNRTNLKEAQEMGLEKIKANADQFALSLSELVMNDKTHSQVARELNSYNIATRRGGKWHAKSVSRLRDRIQELEKVA